MEAQGDSALGTVRNGSGEVVESSRCFNSSAVIACIEFGHRFEP